MHKTCRECGANLDGGEICGCRETPPAEFTKRDLFWWAKQNEGKYPALASLSEETITETSVLKLSVPYGRKAGLIVTFDRTLAAALQRRGEYIYAVVRVRSYEEARDMLLECAEWAKKHGIRSINR